MKAVVFTSNYEYTKTIIGGAERLREIEIVYPGVYSKGRFASGMIRRVIKAGEKVKFLAPLADLYRRYWDRLRKYQRNAPVCVMMFDSFELSKDESFLCMLRKRFKNIKLVLLLFNPVSAAEAERL